MPGRRTGTHDVTALLRAWGGGNLHARDEMLPLVYGELRRRAATHLRRERTVTLEPTALVHEAYLRLVDQRRVDWQNRAHFFAIASQAMRRVLVDRARARRAGKRSGAWARVELDEATLVAAPASADVLDLDAALTELASFDARKSRVAELRFFAGLPLDDIAAVLGISRATAERDWVAARAWLFKALSGCRS